MTDAGTFRDIKQVASSSTNNIELHGELVPTTIRLLCEVGNTTSRSLFQQLRGIIPLPSSHAQERHSAGDDLERKQPGHGIVSKWRQKEKLKTTAVALVLCLNIGVDPPDVIKISPCARLECWVDPMSMQPAKALETIGGAQWPAAAYACVSGTVQWQRRLCEVARSF